MTLQICFCRRCALFYFPPKGDKRGRERIKLSDKFNDPENLLLINLIKKASKKLSENRA
jgi:hypothetical protein